MARAGSLKTADAVPLWGPWDGIHREVPPASIPDKGFYDAWNVVLTEGRIQPRPGFRLSTRYTNTDTDPLSLFEILRDRGGVEYPIKGNSDFTAGTLGVSYWDGAAWSSLVVGLGTSRDTPPVLLPFKDEGLLLPGDGELHKWTPSGPSLVTVDSLQPNTELRPPDKARFIATTASRVFLANGIEPGGSERYPYRVWWSTTLNSNIWSNGTGDIGRGSASYQDLQHDTYPITGLHFHSGQFVMAFKTWSIYIGQWRGSPVWYDFVPITTRVGCIAGKTIRQYQDTVLFLGSDLNVYMLGARGKLQPVGLPVQDYLQGIVDFSKANRAVGLVDHDESLYWLVVPTTAHGSEQARHLLCLDLSTGAWTEGATAVSTLQVLHGTYGYFVGSGSVIFWGSEDGKLYEYDVASPMRDAGTQWEAYVWSKVYDFMEIFGGRQPLASEGEIHKVSIHGSEGTCTPRVRVGRTVQDIESATPTTFSEIDQAATDSIPYVSERTFSERFAQWGLVWPVGTTTPTPVDGVAVWTLPRGGTR